jgi:hypothetical protein
MQATPTVCVAVLKSPAFAALNGVIYGPDQQPFVPHGINVMNFGGNPSASEILSAFPGTDFVRLAIYQYDSPTALAPYVQDLTSHGIVVELENHNNGLGNAGGGQGNVFTGAQLANESAWYSSVAAAFRDNPNVWFGTNNEPPNDPAGVSAWQAQTYDAIRSTGNLAPILLEVNGWADPASFGAGYTSSVYAGMTNVVADIHFYGWVTGYATNQQTNNQFLTAAIASAQRNIVSAGGLVPVLIGEYGNSTTGQGIDPNGQEVVNAVWASGAGSAAWAWGSGNPGDGLTRGDGYGNQVAGYLAATHAGGLAAATSGCAASSTDQLPISAQSNPVITGDALIQQAKAVAAQGLQ